MPDFTAENSKQVRDRRREQTVRTPPEPLLTLEEACQRYFPGKSACALRWMIKRKGYAHSRWGREYRLTYSQVAAIQADMAMPAMPRAPDGQRPQHALSGSRSRRARWQPAAAATGADADADSTPARRKAAPPQNAKRALAEQLSAPLSAVVPKTAR
jgi:hypothetical protein